MASTVAERGRRTAVLRRWPTALAVVAAGLTGLALRGSAPEEVESMAETLILLPLLYLVVAKLRRREASWPVLAVLAVPFFTLQALELIPPSTVFAAVALIVLVWGAGDGQLRRPGAFRVQALGMFGFAAFVLAGLIVAPGVGRYVVAAGWILHGVWDLVHLKLDKVVSRSYAEACAVVDILIGAELILLL